MYVPADQRLATCPPPCGAEFVASNAAAVYCCMGCRLRAEDARRNPRQDYEAPPEVLRERGLLMAQDETSSAVIITLAQPSTRATLGRLQAGNPAQITMRLLLIGGDAEARDALHEHFAASNVRGEWFQASTRLFEAMRWLAENGRAVKQHDVLNGIERLFGTNPQSRLKAEREWERWVMGCEALAPWCPEARRVEPRRRRRVTA